jgi:hypothetical protein
MGVFVRLADESKAFVWRVGAAALAGGRTIAAE